MYRYVIIDEEASDSKILVSHLNQYKQLKLSKIYDDPVLAMHELCSALANIDVIFVDLEMKKMDGMKLMGFVRNKVDRVVLTTSNVQHAINFHQSDADGFLLKPISVDRLNKTLKQLFPIINIHKVQNKDYFILIKSKDQRNRFYKINLEDIIAVEAQERFTKIFTITEIINSSFKLSEILNLLAASNIFHQVHRSFIISEKYIKILERSSLTMSNDLKINIGRKYSYVFYNLTKLRSI